MTWDYACRTGKRRYCTAAAVHAAIRGHAKKHKREKPYRCEHCHGWHLTSYLHETRDKAVAKTFYRKRRP